MQEKLDGAIAEVKSNRSLRPLLQEYVLMGKTTVGVALHAKMRNCQMDFTGRQLTSIRLDDAFGYATGVRECVRLDN